MLEVPSRRCACFAVVFRPGTKGPCHHQQRYAHSHCMRRQQQPPPHICHLPQACMNARHHSFYTEGMSSVALLLLLLLLLLLPLLAL